VETSCFSYNSLLVFVQFETESVGAYISCGGLWIARNTHYLSLVYCTFSKDDSSHG